MLQLQRAFGSGRFGEILDHVLAVAGGLVDGWLADNLTWGYIVKNIAIPVADIFIPMPKGLVHQAEGSLGLMIYALFLRKKEEKKE